MSHATRPRRVRAFNVGSLALAGLLVFASTSCGTDDRTLGANSGAAGQNEEGGGSVSLQLILGASIQLDSVSYEVSGPGYHDSGTIDVRSSETASIQVDGLPFASGYLATLTAKRERAPMLTCSGSSNFAVTSDAVVTVPVQIQCVEAPALRTNPVPAVSNGLMALFAAALLCAGAVLSAQVGARKRELSGAARTRPPN